MDMTNGLADRLAGITPASPGASNNSGYDLSLPDPRRHSVPYTPKYREPSVPSWMQDAMRQQSAYEHVPDVSSVALPMTDAYDRQEYYAQLDKAREFNASEAQKSRDFAERMSNTAIQRAARDAAAAGLNPYVALSGGASTPSGAYASAPTPAGTAYNSYALARYQRDTSTQIANINGAYDLLRQVIGVAGSLIGRAMPYRKSITRLIC